MYIYICIPIYIHEYIQMYVYARTQDVYVTCMFMMYVLQIHSDMSHLCTLCICNTCRKTCMFMMYVYALHKHTSVYRCMFLYARHVLQVHRYVCTYIHI